MRGLLFIAIFAQALAPFMVAMAQGTTSPVITSPTAGQVLHGQVAITGTADIPNFASAELDFAYASDSTKTWFIIQTLSQPVDNSALANWDTTSITDGDYVLRLRVILQDGTSQDATVTIKVQNDIPVPTITLTLTIAPTITSTPQPSPQTPTPMLVTATLTPISTPTTPPFPTPTALLANPAEVTPGAIYTNIQRGALVIVGIFIIFGILLRLRRS